MTKLYLVRHGDYLSDLPEDQAVLSEQGEREIELLARLLQPLQIHVERILHSGKLRAQQTAEILAKGFICSTAPALYTGLKPNDDPKEFLPQLDLYPDNLLIVGHMPFLSRLVSLLVTKKEHEVVINFGMGTCVCLTQVDSDRWVIDWIM